MWLDRLSGNSTPSGSPPSHGRSFSPAPRRSSHLAPGAASRPGFSPRSSSLNVPKFNASTTSLNSSRVVNGSGLKQEITPPTDVIDPLKALEEILGKALRQQLGEKNDTESDLFEKPAQIIEDIQFNGLGLQEFLQDGDSERVNGVLAYDDTQMSEECEYVSSHQDPAF